MSYRLGTLASARGACILASFLLADGAVALTVGHDHDTANIDPASISVVGAETTEPVVSVTAASGWRHFLFSVSNVSGKRPEFRVEDNKGGSRDFAESWAPLWTTDFESYERFSGFTEDSGDLVFQAADSFGSDQVFIVSHPTFRVADTEAFARTLLERQNVSPASEADEDGILGITPSETSQFDRGDVGGHPIFGLTLDWGGRTTDGERKRVLVMINGVHAGEVIDGYAYRGAVEWMLDDQSREAADFRANWIVHLYFNVSPNGRFDGQDRRNGRSYTDPNRDWSDEDGFGLFETALVRDAILADVQPDTRSLDAFFSFHGWRRPQEFLFYYPAEDENEGWRRFRDKLISFENTAGNTRFIESNTATTDSSWGYAKGARISVTNEFNQSGFNDADRYRQVGSYHVRALQLLDQEGFFDVEK